MLCLVRPTVENPETLSSQKRCTHFSSRYLPPLAFNYTFLVSPLQASGEKSMKVCYTFQTSWFFLYFSIFVDSWIQIYSALLTWPKSIRIMAFAKCLKCHHKNTHSSLSLWCLSDPVHIWSRKSCNQLIIQPPIPVKRAYPSLSRTQALCLMIDTANNKQADMQRMTLF